MASLAQILAGLQAAPTGIPLGGMPVVPVAPGIGPNSFDWLAGLNNPAGGQGAADAATNVLSQLGLGSLITNNPPPAPRPGPSDEDINKQFEALFEAPGGPKGSQTWNFQGAPLPMPVMSGGVPNIPFPNIDPTVAPPDFTAMDAALARAKPKDYQEDPEDPVWGLLTGLAQAAAGTDPNSAVGTQLLQLGAGALAGVSAARSAKKEDMLKAEERKIEYELRVSGVELDKARMIAAAEAQTQQNKSQLAIQKMAHEMDIAQANAAAARSNAAAANDYNMNAWKLNQPQISFDSTGNIMTTQQYDPSTGQYTVKREGVDNLMGGLSALRTAKGMGAGTGDLMEMASEMPGTSGVGRAALMFKVYDDMGLTSYIMGDAYQDFE